MKKTIVIVAFCGLSLSLAACDWMQPTVTSPFSGKPVTEAGLVAEMNRAESDARAKATEQADKAAASVRAAKATVARSAVEASLTIEEAGAISDAAQKSLNAALASIQQSGDEAAAAIEAKRSQWLGVVGAIQNVPGVRAVTGAAGVDLGGIAATVMGGGLLYQANRGRKQRADVRTEEQAKAEKRLAEHKATVDAEWQAAKNDQSQQLAMLLALLHPAPVVPTPAATPPGVPT